MHAKTRGALLGSRGAQHAAQTNGTALTPRPTTLQPPTNSPTPSSEVRPCLCAVTSARCFAAQLVGVWRRCFSSGAFVGATTEPSPVFGKKVDGVVWQEAWGRPRSRSRPALPSARRLRPVPPRPLRVPRPLLHSLPLAQPWPLQSPRARAVAVAQAHHPSAQQQRLPLSWRTRRASVLR